MRERVVFSLPPSPPSHRETLRRSKGGHALSAPPNGGGGRERRGRAKPRPSLGEIGPDRRVRDRLRDEEEVDEVEMNKVGVNEGRVGLR